MGIGRVMARAGEPLAEPASHMLGRQTGRGPGKAQGFALVAWYAVEFFEARPGYLAITYPLCL